MIFPFIPLASPKITLSTNVKEIGKEKKTKFYSSPSKREFACEFFLKSLKEVRDFENYFIGKNAALKSFYLPSFKHEMAVFDEYANQNFFKTKNINFSLGAFRQDFIIWIQEKNFISKVSEVKFNPNENSESVFLEDNFNFKINENTVIWELIRVRFNTDELKITKKGAVGYYVSVNFKEVLGENDDG